MSYEMVHNIYIKKKGNNIKTIPTERLSSKRINEIISRRKYREMGKIIMWQDFCKNINPFLAEFNYWRQSIEEKE